MFQAPMMISLCQLLDQYFAIIIIIFGKLSSVTWIDNLFSQVSTYQHAMLVNILKQYKRDLLVLGLVSLVGNGLNPSCTLAPTLFSPVSVTRNVASVPSG